MAGHPPPPPPPPPQPGGETPREAGGHIMQYYAQRGSPPMQLQRLRNHLVRYFRSGGDLPTLERKVFTEQLGPRQLMDFIEQRVGGFPPRPGGPGGMGRPGMAPPAQVVIKEIVKAPCRYCGTLVEVTTAKCPSCGAPPFGR